MSSSRTSSPKPGRKPNRSARKSNVCRLCKIDIDVRGDRHRNLFKLKSNSTETEPLAVKLERLLGVPIHNEPSLSDVICQTCCRKIPRLTESILTVNAWRDGMEKGPVATPPRPKTPLTVLRTPEHTVRGSGTQQKRGLTFTPGKSPLHKKRPTQSVENTPPPVRIIEEACDVTKVQVHVKRPSDKKSRVYEMADKDLPVIRHIVEKKWELASKDIVAHRELSPAVRKQVGVAICQEGKKMAPTSVLGQTSCEDLKSFNLADVNDELETQAPFMFEALRAACGYKSSGSADVAVATAASICLRVPYPTLSRLQYRNSFVLLHAGAKKIAFQRLNRQQMCMSHKSTIAKQREAGMAYDSKIVKWRTDLENYFMAQKVLETIFEISAEEEQQAEKAMQDMSGNSSSTLSFADMSACGFSVTPQDSIINEDSSLNTFEIDGLEAWEDFGVGVLQDVEEPATRSLKERVPGFSEESYGIAEMALQKCSPSDASSPSYTTATITKAISSIEQYFPPWFQLIFDNLDFLIIAKHQGRDNTNQSRHWVHQFGALDRVRTNLPNTTPQKALKDFDLTDVLPTEQTQQQLRGDYIILVARVMVKFIPAFKCLQDVAVWHIPHPYEEEMAQKSEQVWLGLQFKNENLNADMADILKFFHQYVPAERDEDGRILRLLLTILLGGDWLSQERADNVLGAFRDGDDPFERLEGVLPKFELWHAIRNLYTIYHNLFYKDSPADKGSLCSNMNVTRSLSAKKGPHTAYNPYKEFDTNETNSLILHGCTVEFGWESLDVPEEEVIPDFVLAGDKYIRRDWLHRKAAEVVDRFIFNEETANMDDMVTGVRNAGEKPPLPCREPGCKKTYKRAGCRIQHEKDKHGLDFGEAQGESSPSKEDYVYNYHTAKLNMSLLIRNMHDATKEGDGERLARCFRAALLYFKAFGHTKYAMGTLLFFVRVNALLPPKLAHSLLWNRVVNNKGGKGKNIPLDLRLEHMNAFLKSFLRALGPNLNETSASRVACAIGTMEEILQKADRDWAVCAPSGRHIKRDPSPDMDILFRQFASVNALVYEEGREYECFPQFSRNVLSKLSTVKLAQWINRKLTQWHHIYE